jgi:hypothetical protein
MAPALVEPSSGSVADADVEVHPMVLVAQAAMEFGGPRPTFSDYSSDVPVSNPWTTEESSSMLPNPCVDSTAWTGLAGAPSSTSCAVVSAVPSRESWLAPGSPCSAAATASAAMLQEMWTGLENAALSPSSSPQAIVVTFEW